MADRALCTCGLSGTLPFVQRHAVKCSDFRTADAAARQEGRALETFVARYAAAHSEESKAEAKAARVAKVTALRSAQAQARLEAQDRRRRVTGRQVPPVRVPPPEGAVLAPPQEAYSVALLEALKRAQRNAASK